MPKIDVMDRPGTLDYQRSAEPRRYYKTTVVADITGLSRQTIRRAIVAGDLEGYLCGDTWLVPVDAVDPWIRGDHRDAA